MTKTPDHTESIFAGAVALPADERPAYLDKECASDPAFRGVVEALLRAHGRANHLLDQPVQNAPEPTGAYVGNEQPGAIVAGRYKLLQQIGEGGMGSVWMADQTDPVKRRVAVKLVRTERGQSGAILARFEAERQAIALMDHPNIAKLLDAGTTTTGQPYFVMELVKGVPLTEYCDVHKLSIPERLTVFMQICSAVQHAHQKGIIHRDLKPTNILVESHDGKAVPKVIDFGLAKAATGMQLTDRTLFTAFGNVMGTPLYMAPEQAAFNAIDVDTRADVYSLGVILYELLTGTTPITRETVKRAALDEMLKLVREEEAPKPSSRLSTAGSSPSVAANRNIDPTKLSRLLKGDLDWVVLKALEKDRMRRYETANGLAADIQRHLANEPVVARPPSTSYRLQKMIRRNKLAFAAGTAIAASLVIGIAASAWQAVRATLAEKNAVAALDELRATAPAFAEQARALAAKERFAEAIEKLDYAVKLRPEAAEYLVAKGDLLQCQFQLADAAVSYRAALRIDPNCASAAASATLCDDLLAAKTTEPGKLSRESMAKLHLAMQRQQRPAAELMPVARLLGKEKNLLLDYWLARLKDLPVSGEQSLEQRLTVREDGRLRLDLSGTKVASLTPLAAMPLGSLVLRNCEMITDFTPLSEMRSLTRLDLSQTQIADLSPLRDLPLEFLHLDGTRTFDLSALRGMKLTTLHIRNTRVADLSPLAGMPITNFDATAIPAIDYAPLAGAPLEECILQHSPVKDLSFLRDAPVRELTLYNCNDARGFAVLASLKSLDLLILPQRFRNLPENELAAIGALRSHPTLKNIQTELRTGIWQINSAQSKDVFWKDWKVEQTFVPALRKSGFQFSLSKLASGTYSLTIENQPFSDLSVLKGAPISDLWLNRCKVRDLSPIQDLPLRVLGLFGNPVADLSPLRKMPIKELSLEQTQVSDLAPLTGLQLEKLYLHECAKLTDVSALTKIPTLQKLTVPPQVQHVEKLRALPNLKWLAFAADPENPDFPVTAAEQFWQEFGNLGWLWEIQNARFTTNGHVTQLKGGTWDIDLSKSAIIDLSILRGAPISQLWLHETNAADLEPLRGMPLKKLHLYSSKVTDLSPLQGMPLNYLNLVSTKVADISALRGMPLTGLRLNDCSEITDISPLAEAKTLIELTLPPRAQNIEFLRALSNLQRLSYSEDPNNQWRPNKTTEEFWRDYDAAKK